jgi:hypothetical protein
VAITIPHTRRPPTTPFVVLPDQETKGL